MTDEGRAEESYVKYRDEKCEITRNTNNHLHKDWRKSGVDRHKAYSDGFLDGLAEGREEILQKVRCCLNCKCKEDCRLEDYYDVCIGWEKA